MAKKINIGRQGIYRLIDHILYAEHIKHPEGLYAQFFHKQVVDYNYLYSAYEDVTADAKKKISKSKVDHFLVVRVKVEKGKTIEDMFDVMYELSKLLNHQIFGFGGDQVNFEESDVFAVLKSKKTNNHILFFEIESNF